MSRDPERGDFVDVGDVDPYDVDAREEALADREEPPSAWELADEGERQRSLRAVRKARRQP